MPRATEHNGRTRSNGEVYSPKHNDRKFNEKNSPHIDGNLSENNKYFYCESDVESQEENESHFYSKHFTAHLEEQNERYIHQRHTDKVKTMDQYRGSKQTCPEETLYQLGTVEEKDVSAEKLLEIVKEQLAWIEVIFPQVKILGYAMHLDEPDCAPHIHVRRVWIAHDGNGNEIVSQTKALEEMGIKPPKEDETINRYNNPKVTFTLACRDHYETLCRERGIEIPKERKEASEVGLEFKDYKCKIIEKKIEKLNVQNEMLTEQNDKLAAHITELTEKNKKLIKEKEKAEAELNNALEIINKNKPTVSPETRKIVRSVVHSIDDLNKRVAEIEVKEKELEKREKTINRTERKLRTLIDNLDIKKIIQGVIDAFAQLIYVFAGEIYNKLRQFLKLHRKEALLEEFDKYYVQEKMNQMGIDLSKQIKKAEKELDITMQEYRDSSFELDER